MEVVHMIISVDGKLGCKCCQLGSVNVGVLVLRHVLLQVLQQFLIGCSGAILAVGCVPPPVNP